MLKRLRTPSTPINALALCGMLSVAAPLYGLAQILQTARETPDTSTAMTTLQDWRPAPRARILSNDGQTIGYAGTRPFAYTPLESIAPELVQAVIAIEDRTFETNPGIDLHAMLRAAISSVSGRPEGASTITQQLAKIVFLDGNTSTWRRKRQQIVLALRISHDIPKRRVMELYLNTVSFGRGTTGIAQAASRYFNVRPADLSLEQCATLAAMIRAPTRLDPIRHPAATRTRRNLTLDAMLDTGSISKARHDAAVNSPIGLDPGPSLPPPSTTTPTAESDIFGWARDIAMQATGANTQTHPADIQTTIDPRAQEILSRNLTTGLARLEMSLNHTRLAWSHSPCGTPLPAPTPDLIAQTPQWTHPARICNHRRSLEDTTAKTPIDLDRALSWTQEPAAANSLHDGDVIMIGTPTPDEYPTILPPITLNGSAILANGTTGAVLAIDGGIRWTPAGFDRATSAMRPPGSAIKPYVYLSAIDRGWKPDDLVFDIPVSIPAPGGAWTPSNDDDSVAGPIPMRTALAQSRNLATVNLANTLGFADATRHLVSTGITPRADNPSAVLGAIETTPWRMARALSIMVNNGYETDLHLTQTPQSSGNSPQRDADGTSIDAVRSMMHGVLDTGGTAAAQKRIAEKLQEAGYPTGAKTGTTSDFTDVWFIAYAGPYTIVIQAGYDTPRTIARGAFASDTVAPIAMTILEQYLLKDARNAR